MRNGDAAPVSIKAVFAGNLRLLCAARGLSINAACKGMGIARSQMDRYLDAKNLPNNRNLARIAGFFGVSETALFAVEAAFGGGQAAGLATICRDTVESLLASGPSAIPPGDFQTFYAQPHDPSRVMVSLTLVRRKGDVTMFRRITRFPGGSKPRKAQFYAGDHQGVVVDRLSAHYFLGLNRVGTREPSVAVVRAMPFGETALRGRALVMAEESPMSLPLVMRPLPAGVTLREAVRQLGLASINSDVVGPLARRLLRHAAP